MLQSLIYAIVEALVSGSHKAGQDEPTRSLIDMILGILKSLELQLASEQGVKNPIERLNQLAEVLLRIRMEVAAEIHLDSGARCAQENLKTR